MNRTGLRPAWRMARREAVRHKTRSSLVVMLIGLPVLGGVSGDLLARTAALTPTERATRTFGAAEAILAQLPPAPGAPAEPGVDADVAAMLPSGSQILPLRRNLVVTVHTPAGATLVKVTEVAYDSALARGIYRQLTGRAPLTPTEVAVSPRVAKMAKLHINDRLRTETPAHQTFTVVGTVLSPNDTHGAYLLASPRAIDDHGAASPQAAEWLVTVAGGLTADIERHLAAQGVVVAERRSATLHPVTSRVTSDRTLRIVTLGTGLAVLEVVLLGGAAFAVGARRQRRELGLFAAAGADRARVRAVVLAGGLVLGLAGGLGGLVGGVLVAVAVRPLLESTTGFLYGGWQIHPQELAGVALFGLGAALAAATLPAWAASRHTVLAALVDRESSAFPARRAPVVALAALVGGVVLTWVSARGESHLGLVLAGTLLSELGLVACTPALVASLRKSTHLQVSLRLALRDAARNRTRSATAVAAIAAAMGGSVAAAFALASSDAAAHARYEPYLRVGQIQLSDTVVATRVLLDAATVRAVAAQLPASRSARFTEITACTHADRCPTVRLAPPVRQLCGAHPTPRCLYPSTLVGVGDAAAVEAISGREDPGAQQALDDGLAVVFDPHLIRGGAVVMQIEPSGGAVGDGKSSVLDERRVTARVLRADVPGGLVGAIISPRTAGELRLPGEQVARAVIDTTRMPTEYEEQRARQVLLNRSPELFLALERGYQGRFGAVELVLLAAAALVTIGATVVATALAAMEARADLATLAAIGAAPSLRRSFSAASAATIAGLGAALGIAVGSVPVLAALSGQRSYPVIVPWTQVGLLVGGCPVLAALVAGLFSGGRVPLNRRIG